MSGKDERSMLSKMLSTGLGALFMTEENIRKGLKPLGLPRDASNYLLRQVERRKDEMMQVVRDEIHQALATVPFERIAREILTTNDIELTVRFVPHQSKSSRPLSYRWKSRK